VDRNPLRLPSELARRSIGADLFPPAPTFSNGPESRYLTAPPAPPAISCPGFFRHPFQFLPIPPMGSSVMSGVRIPKRTRHPGAWPYSWGPPHRPNRGKDEDTFINSQQIVTALICSRSIRSYQDSEGTSAIGTRKFRAEQPCDRKRPFAMLRLTLARIDSKRRPLLRPLMLCCSETGSRSSIFARGGTPTPPPNHRRRHRPRGLRWSYPPHIIRRCSAPPASAGIVWAARQRPPAAHREANPSSMVQRAVKALQQPLSGRNSGPRQPWILPFAGWANLASNYRPLSLFFRILLAKSARDLFLEKHGDGLLPFGFRLFPGSPPRLLLSFHCSRCWRSAGLHHYPLPAVLGKLGGNFGKIAPKDCGRNPGITFVNRGPAMGRLLLSGHSLGVLNSLPAPGKPPVGSTDP